MSVSPRDRAAVVVAVCLLLAPSALLIELAISEAWYWHEARLNLAEAALLKDGGEMQRQLWNGANPRLRERVRAELVDRTKDTDAFLTPMEATILRDRRDLAGLLLRWGAVTDPKEAGRLRCLAKEQHADDVARVIEEMVSNVTRDPCAEIPVPW
jgi:hypothetical protein